MKQSTPWFKTETARYALYGVLFGIIFPIVATIVDILVQGLTLTMANVLWVQKTQPLHWIIDMAPFFLGLLAALIGKRQEQINQINLQLEQRVAKHTTELENVNLELQNEIATRRETETALQKFTRAVTAEIEGDFFSSLVMHFANSLHVDYVFVGEFNEESQTVTTVAVSAGGEIIPNFTYSLEGAPCQDVIGGEHLIISEKAPDLYPDSELFGEKGIGGHKVPAVEGYIGYPLSGAYEQPLGLFVMMDSQPLTETDLKQSLLKIFSPHAAYQLERKQIEEELLLISEIVGKFSLSLKQLHRLHSTNYDSLEDLFTHYLQTGCETFGLPNGVISQINGQSYLIRSVQSGFDTLKPGMEYVLADTCCQKVVEANKTITCSGQIYPAYKTLKLQAYIGTPVCIGSELYGTLNFFSTEADKEMFEKHELEVIEHMAQSIGVEIERRQAEEALKESYSELNKAHQELQSAQMQLAERNSQLIETLENLKDTQSQLIEADRMAALGQLIAGIAHEINTPLGAIGASISNISNALDDSIHQLPQLFQRLSPQQQQDFFALLDKALCSQPTLSSREERKFKHTLSRELETQGVDEADTVADTLVDMGIYEDVDAFIPLFQSEDTDFILQAAYNLSSQQRNSRNIVTAVERVSKMVFALKRYIHRDPSGEMIEANITDGIDVVLTLYYNQIKHGVELIKKFQDVPAIRCTPDELNQVWTNLIHNALQAMNYEGQLEIAIFQQNGQVVTQITDSGPGIPNEIKERIFDPFFTTKPAGEGSGLGLDIVRKIVEKHQGKVEVESHPGRTTFSVRLPIEP